jgi:transposase
MSVEHDPTGRREAGHITVGIDLASAEHAVALVDANGVEVQRISVQHDAAGLRRLVRSLASRGVVDIAIERGDGPLVDALLDGGFTVFVIPPNQVRNLRRRYESAGNKTTASTPTFWPTPCAPTVHVCGR